MTKQELDHFMSWGSKYTMDKQTGVCLKVSEPSVVNKYGSLSTMSKANCARWKAAMVKDLGPEGMEGLYLNGDNYSQEKGGTDAV
jgi:hypothetical protein